jgi:hypothetical protein
VYCIYFEEGWGACECNLPGGSGISSCDRLLCFRTEKERLLGCKKIQLTTKTYGLVGFTFHTLVIGFLYIRTLQQEPFNHKLLAIRPAFCVVARHYEKTKIFSEVIKMVYINKVRQMVTMY